MKVYSRIRLGLITLCLWFVLWPTAVHAACRNPNIAGLALPKLRYAATSKNVTIEWFGHAFFQITSSTGTRIITDPFRYMGYPMPDVWPHVITVSKETLPSTTTIFIPQVTWHGWEHD